MIEPVASYRLIYTSVAFARNRPFLERLRKNYGVEIPFLDADLLSEEMREALDTYLYIKEDAAFKGTFAKITCAFPQVSFTNLGTIKGREILKMLDTCATEMVETTQADVYYRIMAGPLRNLIVRATKIDGGQATVEYEIFKKVHSLDMPIANLSKVDSPLDFNASFRNLIKEAQSRGQHKAVIIDGNNVLYRSMFGYYREYMRSTNRFVGGALGFYFTLLKMKRLYPEYEMHVVFDGWDEAKMVANPDYKANRISNTAKFKYALLDNQDWVKRFTKAVGFYLYHLSDCEADDVIGSLAVRMQRQDYQHVIIHSMDTDFYQLVSDRIELCLPKQTFRGHQTLIKLEDAIKEFGVTDVSKINWVRAISGDKSDNICSVNLFNKNNGVDHTNLRKADYLPIINAVATIDGLRRELAAREPYRLFVEGGQFDRNHTLLTIRRTIMDAYNSLDAFAAVFSESDCHELLEEVGFYKELEQFDKIARVLQGIC